MITCQVKIRNLLAKKKKKWNRSPGQTKCTFEMVPNFSSSVSTVPQCQALISDHGVKIAPVEHQSSFILHSTTNLVQTKSYSQWVWLNVWVLNLNQSTPFFFQRVNINGKMWKSALSVHIWIINLITPTSDVELHWARERPVQTHTVHQRSTWRLKWLVIFLDLLCLPYCLADFHQIWQSESRAHCGCI